MASDFDPVLLLRVVEDSGGQWDTRNIDFEYHRRGGRLAEGNVLQALRALASGGLVVEVPISGGTGPAWRLTAAGRAALGGEASRPAYPTDT